MKKNYLGKLCLLAVLGLMCNWASAQGVWKTNGSKAPNYGPVPCEQADQNSVENRIYLGYTGPDAYIYPYDGLSIDNDAKVGVAIKLPREKFASYIGGKLSALYVGWDTEDVNGTIEAFVRTSFDGKDLATGKGEVRMGWNTVKLDQSLTLPDVDTLVLGYYTQLKANVIAIPKVYPVGQPHSCYLWMEGDMTSEGKENWIDSKDFGTMTLLGIIEDTEGRFSNLLVLDGARFDQIYTRDSIGTAFVSLRNVGSNVINSMEVTSEFEGKTWSMELPFEKGIAPSTGGRVYMPYNVLGSGTNTFLITKVNGMAVKEPQSVDVNLIAVPSEVAAQYSLHHLIEFWTSENSYCHITYFEEYTRPYLEEFSERVTLVNQHTDDQFMTGEEDDVARMMLDFVNNDSSRVFIPSLSINRNRYTMNRAAADDGPLCPVFYPEYGKMMMEQILDYPTFASVNVDAQWVGENKAKFVVSGNVAENIMPVGESLYLTVYLMEYDVETDSQIFWDENQQAQYGGTYNHYNIIREILTPVYGEKLVKTGGEYTQIFEVEMDESWNTEKMGVVAFLNRGVENGNFERQVINSCEKKLGTSTGIEGVDRENQVTVPVAVYNMAGVQVHNMKNKGVYLVKSMKNGKPMVRKVLVK